MKNKHILDYFMKENNLEFNKPFLVKTDYDCINKIKCRITEKDGEWGIMPQIEYYNDKKEEWIETSMHWLILVMFGEDFKITLLNQKQKDMKNSTAMEQIGMILRKKFLQKKK